MGIKEDIETLKNQQRIAVVHLAIQSFKDYVQKATVSDIRESMNRLAKLMSEQEDGLLLDNGPDIEHEFFERLDSFVG